jgi:hypothetical protein
VLWRGERISYFPYDIFALVKRPLADANRTETAENVVAEGKNMNAGGQGLSARPELEPQMHAD